MDAQAFRESARERIRKAKAEKEHHEREMIRLDRIVTSLEDYLANDTESTSDSVVLQASPAIPPLTAQTPSHILLPFLRKNLDLTREEAHQILVEAGHDFKDANRSRVVANALSMAKKLAGRERGEVEDSIGEA